jgi:hypothetical protein
MPAQLTDKYQYFTEAKMNRLEAAGYAKPFTELEAGVGEYIHDYLTREDPYRLGLRILSPILGRFYYKTSTAMREIS